MTSGPVKLCIFHLPCGKLRPTIQTNEASMYIIFRRVVDFAWLVVFSEVDTTSSCSTAPPRHRVIFRRCTSIVNEGFCDGLANLLYGSTASPV